MKVDLEQLKSDAKEIIYPFIASTGPQCSDTAALLLKQISAALSTHLGTVARLTSKTALARIAKTIWYPPIDVAVVVLGICHALSSVDALNGKFAMHSFRGRPLAAGWWMDINRHAPGHISVAGQPWCFPNGLNLVDSDSIYELLEHPVPLP